MLGIWIENIAMIHAAIARQIQDGMDHAYLMTPFKHTALMASIIEQLQQQDLI